MFRQAEGKLSRGIGFILWSVLMAFVAKSLHDRFGESQAGFISAVAFVIVAVGGGFYASYMHPRFGQFMIEVDNELNHVVWPAWKLVKQYAVQVVVVMILFMGYMWGLDEVLLQLRALIYG